MGEVGSCGDGFFSGTPRLGRVERTVLLACLAEVDGRLAAAGGWASPAAAPPGWAGRAAAVLASATSGEDGTLRRWWLDLAAELEEGAEDVAAAGLGLEALAMEGVAGRLLGVLLGEGPAPAARRLAGRR